MLVVTALALLVGMAIGGGITAAVTGSRPTGGHAASAPSVVPATPASAASGRVVVIPASCERGLDRAQSALSTTQEAVQALRALEMARLQELLNQLQHAQAEVDALVAQCRQQTRAMN